MHAIVLEQFGPPENLRYEEVADPDPGPGQVRIAVGAAGVHLIDTTLREGQARGPLPLPALPHIPGREVAGIVDAVGPDVTGEWLGRRVVTHLGPASGGYAELAVRDVEQVQRVPDGLADDVAVALVGTGRTAMGILDAARLTAADVVVVTAAAGGLGSLLVQAGHHAGATVVGVAGGLDKVARVRALGADVAVDYLGDDWPARVRGLLGDRLVTAVLDGVGGEAGRAALELLAPGGRLLFFGFSSGRPTSLSAGDLFTRGITASAAIGPAVAGARSQRQLEDAALAAGAEGWFVPLVTRFALADAAGAHRALQERGTMGKVVLIP